MEGSPSGVERESVQHGPLRDDDLAKNVEDLIRGAPVASRAAENRRLEDPVEDTGVEAGGRPDTGRMGGLDEEELDERAELSALLVGLHYPATRDDAAETAARNGASEAVIGRLRSLPAGEFAVFEAIWEALGGQPD